MISWTILGCVVDLSLVHAQMIMQLSKEARLQAWSQLRLSSYRGLWHGEVSCALLLQKWKYQGAAANQGITSPILGNLKPV